jgi:hypothetical protein
MTTQAIVESGMTFGPYPEGQCFYVEQSPCYTRIREGVQIAEFLLLRQQQEGPTVWVVEAKSSSPRPDKVNFAAFIDEVRSKLTNAFLLTIAVRLQRHNAARDELPDSFKALDLQTLQFRFVLVINGHDPQWLAPLHDALSRALRPVVKTWALPAIPVLVLNHTLAQKHNLILPLSGAAS